MNNLPSFLKRGYKTNELRLTIILLLGGVYPVLTSPNIAPWSYGVTLLCSAYSISRRLMKHGRGHLLHPGEKSTELYVAVAGAVALLLASKYFHLDSALAYLESCIIVSTWAIACGHSKSLPPSAGIPR